MALKLSHVNTTVEPGTKHGEYARQLSVLEAESAQVTNFSFKPSPQKEATKRIPDGVIFGEVPLEAAKAYPTRTWQDTGLTPRIAYADQNTHNETNTLTVKLLPNGGKTAPHPQIVFFVNGPYHVETLGYARSNAWNWTTWMEVHLDAVFLDQLINGLIKAKLALEAKT